MTSEFVFCVFIWVGNEDTEWYPLLSLLVHAPFQAVAELLLHSLWAPWFNQLHTHPACSQGPCEPRQILLASALPPAAALTVSVELSLAPVRSLHAGGCCVGFPSSVALPSLLTPISLRPTLYFLESQVRTGSHCPESACLQCVPRTVVKDCQMPFSSQAHLGWRPLESPNPQSCGAHSWIWRTHST